MPSLRYLLVSLLLHTTLLGLLAIQGRSIPRVVPSQKKADILRVNTVPLQELQFIKERREREKEAQHRLKQAEAKRLKKIQEAQQKQAEAKRLKEAQEAQQKQAEAKRLKEAQEAQQKQAEAKRLKKIQEAQQKQAEAKRLKEAQEAQQKQAEAKRLKEAQEAQQKQAEAKRLKEAQEAQQKQAEAKRLKEAQEAQQKQAEAKRLERLAQQQRDQLTIRQYKHLIIERIANKFNRTGLSPGLSCVLLIRVARSGDILRVEVIESSGNDVFDQRAIDAVLAASPLPLPEETRVSNEMRTLRTTFRPWDE